MEIYHKGIKWNKILIQKKFTLSTYMNVFISRDKFKLETIMQLYLGWSWTRENHGDLYVSMAFRPASLNICGEKVYSS